MSSTFSASSLPSISLFNSSISKSLSLPNLRFSPPTSLYLHRHPLRVIRASSSSSSVSNGTHPVLQTLQNCARAAILIAATSTFVANFSHSPARAESPAASIEEQTPDMDQHPQLLEPSHHSSPLNDFLESNSQAVEALKSLLQQKLENGEDQESLQILKQLVSAQPLVTEWKFLMARLLGEMGKTEDARSAFEDILAVNPLSFEALFENALLMDRCGEGEAVLGRLEEALRIAEDDNKAKEARDVKLIMAQIHFLQKNVEEALNAYKELVKEDSSDFRPYFCQGMIYSLLDKNVEAKEQFAKYRELSPKKFEVDGYLRTPLSRMKLFGSDEN